MLNSTAQQVNNMTGIVILEVYFKYKYTLKRTFGFGYFLIGLLPAGLPLLSW